MLSLTAGSEDCAAAAVLSSPGHENKAYDITGPELVGPREIAAAASAGHRSPSPATTSRNSPVALRQACVRCPKRIRANCWARKVDRACQCMRTLEVAGVNLAASLRRARAGGSFQTWACGVPLRSLFSGPAVNTGPALRSLVSLFPVHNCDIARPGRSLQSATSCCL